MDSFELRKMLAEKEIGTVFDWAIFDFDSLKKAIKGKIFRETIHMLSFSDVPKNSRRRTYSFNYFIKRWTKEQYVTFVRTNYKSWSNFCKSNYRIPSQLRQEVAEVFLPNYPKKIRWTKMNETELQKFFRNLPIERELKMIGLLLHTSNQRANRSRIAGVYQSLIEKHKKLGDYERSSFYQKKKEPFEKENETRTELSRSCAEEALLIYQEWKAEKCQDGLKKFKIILKRAEGYGIKKECRAYVALRYGDLLHDRITYLWYWSSDEISKFISIFNIEKEEFDKFPGLEHFLKCKNITW